MTTCTCQNRKPGRPHLLPCPLMGKFAGRKQPPRPMTAKQVEQRRAFDARRVVLPESIATEVKVIAAYVAEHPGEGERVAKRLRDVFPFAFRGKNNP